MMRDGVVLRSIPFVTSGLAFVPACNDDGGTATTDVDTGSATITVTASDSGTTESVDGTGEESTTDTPTTAEESSSDGSSSESGDPQCGGANTCGAVPPIGWFGPTIYARVPPGDAPPACPPEVADPGPTVLEGFVDPGPAVCGCECTLSRPQTCNSSMVASSEPNCSQECIDYGYYGYNYCYQYSGSYAVTESCLNVDVDGFVRFNSSDDYYYYGYGNPPTCEETESEVIPPLQWAASITTCRIPDTALPCDDGVCVPPAPEGFESKWCMYQQGDLECPSGPYPVKTLFWSGVEDTRSCTNCTCGMAAQTCETAELMVFGGADCAGAPVANIPGDNVCRAATGGSVAGNFGAQAACPVTEAAMPQGTIVPTGAFTFCCSE